MCIIVPYKTVYPLVMNSYENFLFSFLAVNLVMDRIANRPRGFAFLRYATVEESEKAIEGMHGKVISAESFASVLWFRLL